VLEYVDSLRPTRHYITGNHDRLCLVDDALMELALLNLNAELGMYRHPNINAILADRYGVIGRHGHELDAWNFEAFDPKVTSPGGYTAADYLLTPIGDVITTEVISRLPYAVYNKLMSEGKIDPSVVEQLYLNLQDIENVRPMSAVIPWILHTTQRFAQEIAAVSESDQKRIINGVLRVAERVFREFMRMPFVKAWLKKHDVLGLDQADVLQSINSLLAATRPGTARSFIDLVLRTGVVDKLTAGNKFLEGAMTESLDEESGMNYVVYGHTHSPEMVPMRVERRNGIFQEQIYFNSGTWRPRHHGVEQGQGFVSTKHMSYLIFYREDEANWRDGRPKGVSFETWDGRQFKEVRS
jgi:hypothetical protein